jgi:hypothetical protein
MEMLCLIARLFIDSFVLRCLGEWFLPFPLPWVQAAGILLMADLVQHFDLWAIANLERVDSCAVSLLVGPNPFHSLY